LFISGFLSSVKPKTSGPFVTVRGIIKRAIELAGVYILWNLLVAIAVFFLNRIGASPGDFLSSRLDNQASGIFGLDSPFPIAYQFWFIRELIVISMVIGCIGELTENQRILTVIFFIIVSLAILFFDYRTSVSFAAYCAGYWLGRERVKSEWQELSPSLLRIYLSVGLVASSTLLFLCAKKDYWTGIWITTFLGTGTASVLAGALIFAPHAKNTFWPMLAKATFFIFAAHEPLLTAAKKMAGAKLSADFVYIIAPISVVLSLFAVYFLIPTRVKNAFWFIFLGSRPHRQTQDHQLKKPIFG
jgi:hypothetical protein